MCVNKLVNILTRTKNFIVYETTKKKTLSRLDNLIIK